MFGFFMLSTPIGLGVYWIVSNLLGIGQYYLTKPMMDRARLEHGIPNPTVKTTGTSVVQSKATQNKVTSPAPIAPPPKSKVRAKNTIGKSNSDDKTKK
jgi:membrane protein insertase Oxa1/YidC/SpoIIIJ